MSQPPRRQVVLRYRAADSTPRLRADLSPSEIEAMQAAAERMGLPRHPDPQLAAMLAAVRTRDDMPPTLYAAAAAVLAAVYAAAGGGD